MLGHGEFSKYGVSLKIFILLNTNLIFYLIKEFLDKYFHKFFHELKDKINRKVKS